MTAPSIATLPLADWPPFAVAPWRGGDGRPVVPVAFRRATGRHLAALRQRSMSLDATSEAAIVPHLAELERHYRSKLGFYIACGHLIAALTAIHPRVDWEWMRRWRLDWRLAKLPRRQQVRPDQDLPFSALPFPQWPRELRQRWKANAPTSWRPLTAHEYRRAYGRFRAYCAQNGGAVAHTRQKLGAYVDFLAAATPATARCHVGLLHGALAVLFPAEDWLWLLQRRRELAVQPMQTAPPSARKAPGLSIPFAAWEPADRRRWHRGLTPQATGTHLERAARRRHELTDGGPLSVALPTERRRPTHQWSTATIRSARYAYGAFLKFARERDGADCAVTPQAVAAWVETMLGRMTPLSLGNRVRDLHAAMRILDPDGDWRWLRCDADILLRDARPIREKTTRMASIPDIRRAAIRRMRRAEQAPALITSALMFQDGFITLLLSYRPVRRRNLAATRLGTNLVFDAAFTSGRLRYDDTKMGNRYDVALPVRLLPWARQFIAVFRPILVGPDVTSEAWLSRHGTPLSADQLCRRIARVSEEELGKRVTPHLFRDCLATTVSETAPERIEDAARLLGHREGSGKTGPYGRTPAIETYRQVSGSTAAGRKLAALQEHYRVRPRPAAPRRVELSALKKPD